VGVLDSSTLLLGLTSKVNLCQQRSWSLQLEFPKVEAGEMTRVTRHSRDELRELILETGRTMLKEEGLSSGATALTFKRVFARIGKTPGFGSRTPRSSVGCGIASPISKPICW